MLAVTSDDVVRMRDAVFFEGDDTPQRLSRFWVLLILAAIIASAGVVGDSTATVTRLVAAGLTNKEVAARLYLSPHTVNTHLRHVFAKLGVANRAGLASVLALHSIE